MVGFYLFALYLFPDYYYSFTFFFKKANSLEAHAIWESTFIPLAHPHSDMTLALSLPKALPTVITSHTHG